MKFSLLFLLWLLSSCAHYRYIYYDLDRSPEIKNILLLSVELEQKDSIEVPRVIYPSDSFRLKNFLLGLVEEFNQNSYGVNLIFWDDLKSQEKILTQSKIPEVYSIEEQTLTLKGSLKRKELKKYHQVFNQKNYLTLVLNLVTWEQKVTGWVKLRDHQGNIVWREELKHQSGYIHNDPDSPYRSKNHRVRQKTTDRSSNHYLEMEKTFRHLGTMVAKSLKETLVSIKRLAKTVEEKHSLSDDKKS